MAATGSGSYALDTDECRASILHLYDLKVMVAQFFPLVKSE